MLLDHIGLLLLPEIQILRIIGRISFPIYAFLIGEGCKHTKNKKRYFLKLLITAIIFQTIHILMFKKLDICVLFGFALFVLFTIIMDWAKKDWNKRFLIAELFAIISCIFLFATKSQYYMFTFLLPLIVYVCKKEWIKIGLYTIAIFALGFLYKNQMFALLAVVPLVLYNGQKGNNKYKNAFYIFYPTHFAILWILQLLI